MIRTQLMRGVIVYVEYKTGLSSTARQLSRRGPVAERRP